MASDVAHLMCLFAICITAYWNVFMSYLFSDWIVCLLPDGCQEYFVCFRCKSFVEYVVQKYILPVFSLPFQPLKSLSQNKSF